MGNLCRREFRKIVGARGGGDVSRVTVSSRHNPDELTESVRAGTSLNRFKPDAPKRVREDKVPLLTANREAVCSCYVLENGTSFFSNTVSLDIPTTLQGETQVQG